MTASDPPELSIVLPTCNRAFLLERALAAIEFNTRASHEIIVVDGASTDQTHDVLERTGRFMGERLKVIHEEQREGFVRAVNKGLRAARGKYLTWVNDDARPLPECFDTALLQIQHEPDDVAFVALFHRWNTTRTGPYETRHHARVYAPCHTAAPPYANFPPGH